MDVTVIATLVAVGLLVVALAAYLVVIAVVLWRADAAVGRVGDNLRRLAAAAEPLSPALGEINADLAAAVHHLQPPEPAPADTTARTGGS